MIELTDEQWQRVQALLPKLKKDKAARDNVKSTDLTKLSKAELIDLVKTVI